MGKPISSAAPCAMRWNREKYSEGRGQGSQQALIGFS